jgi:chorismate synthase
MPPPQLRAAVEKWAAPASVTRFEFAFVDLNSDKTLDAVVRVTDADRCGNGGCILLVFKGTPDGYENVGDSGYVAKPIFVMKEVNSGWTSLAGVVGLSHGSGVRPIRYMGTKYRSNPIVRGHVEITQSNHEGPALTFEVAE